MPKVNSLQSMRYGPRPMVAKPLRKTPYDQSRSRPTQSEPSGYVDTKRSNLSGGAMNAGGKRRPGHNARYGID